MERKDDKMFHNFSFNSYFSATEPSHEKKIRFMSKIKSQNKDYNQLFRTLVSLEVKEMVTLEKDFQLEIDFGTFSFALIKSCYLSTKIGKGSMKK